MRIASRTASSFRHAEPRRARALPTPADRKIGGGARRTTASAPFAALAIMLGASAACADESSAPLETVVVTATRSPQPLDRTGTSMSVITADDLAAQQIDVVSDALAQTPGLAVVRNGGTGQNTDILLRGAEAGQTLVLVDGIRINDPSATSGFALLGDVLVNGIDRIEVLRGPQSTLYGGDAIGGVVNILTRRGGDAPFAGRASAEGGSFDTWHLNAAANGTEGALAYGTALNWYSTAGISAADERNGNTEADGYRNFGATANTRIGLSPGVSIDLRGYYTQSHTAIDGFPPPNFTFQDDPEFGNSTLTAGYAGLNFSLLGGRLQNRIAFTGSQSNRKFFGEFDFVTGAFSPDENFFARGSASRVEYEGVLDLDGDNQIVFGAETERVGLSTQSLQFDPAPTFGHRRTTGYYAQWQSTFADQLTVTGGIRLEDNSEFGTHTSFKLAGSWRVPGWDAVLRASYGDGFKAPSLYELFSQYSNPLHALRPETAGGWEVGADKFVLDGKLRGSVTWFQRNTRDQIDFQTCFTANDAPGCPFRLAQGGYYENLDRTRARGLEVEMAAAPTDRIALQADYTYLEAQNVLTGTELARRPVHSASGRITWAALPRLSLGSSIVYVGPRFDDLGNLRRLPANTTVNLFASYAAGGGIELYARMENLFDERNEPVFGYGRMGRAVYGGLRVAF